MATIAVEIVSAESEIFSGEAEMVFAPAVMGEVGIAPGHAALMSPLGPGEVRVTTSEGEDQAFYISGGILEVQPKLVTVLSDTAVRAADIDEAAAVKAKQQAEDALLNNTGEMEIAEAQSQLAEMAAQLQVLQRLRRRTGRG